MAEIQRVTDPKRIVTNELVSLRTENSKTFDLGNGKRQLVASIGAIHYKDDYANKLEHWKDIDLTWENNKITKAPYELTQKGNKLVIRNKRTGAVTTIELDEIGGEKTPALTMVRSKGLAKVSNIVLDTDLEVIAEFSAVKFRRVLKSDKAPLEAKFKITGDSSLVKVRASDEENPLPVETSLKDGILTETLRPNRAIKYPVKIDPIWQVGANSDDCSRKLGENYWSLTSPYQYAGAAGSDNRQYGGGMCFTNITIPKGSAIDAAYLRLRCRSSNSGTTCNTRISAEDVDDAVTFADDANAFDTRWAARTTARVDWDNIPAQTLGTDYNSPEIKTVIQEIVDRANWASGNGIVIFWDDFDDRSTHAADCWRAAYPYDESPTYASKLVVTYTTGTAFERELSTALGLSASLARSQGFVRSLSITTGLDTTLTRAVTYARALTTDIRLSVSLDRAVEYIRSLSTSMGMSATLSRAQGFVRSLSTSIGLSATLSRTIGYGRSLSTSIGLYVRMFWRGKFKRPLKSIGTNRTQSTIGTNRDIQSIGTDRTLGEVGTPRDVEDIGTNRDMEVF